MKSSRNQNIESGYTQEILSKTFINKHKKNLNLGFSVHKYQKV